ncbi:MAG: RsmF rRNA methyltransferase first C-terminal domain-containing protein [Clostridiales bacterium]|nr:RsmF rRNA methyltransferase first C-terminal domain-containing protein [Clostridiales bacterium]MDY4112475.1 RsmF rRNA methyltransferase first C-terminal domain-containing protein [Roseburia sp.]
MLPQDFLDRMKEMLREEYPAFLASYDEQRYHALRINTLKTEKEHFLAQAPFSLEPVPWSPNGFYYEAEAAPGKHPYHEAGVYYIQEPSAMAPVEFLMRPLDGKDLWKDERILDLCAAPGGKSTQIAAAMQGKGVLICNEIHPTRAKILSENVERMGICNAMVTNETPQRLSEHFSDYFTRILVDAPCSGEGMFRKNEDACDEWSLANVDLCAERQDEILDCAASMLASGGRLVYSTCTFAPTENEGSVSRFLLRHPDFFVEKVELTRGMQAGMPAWGAEPFAALSDTVRLWPHRIKGEGHYMAVLRKQGSLSHGSMGCCRNGAEQGLTERECKVPGKGCVEYLEFVKEALQPEKNEGFLGRYLKFGEQLYLIPEGMPAVKGLKVLRPGLHLGTIKKNRFEPSHALALALRGEDVLHTVDLPADGREVRGYLNGETFSHEGEKGWYLLTVDGYSIGWGKLAGGVMKNHYPKGLRKYV